MGRAATAVHAAIVRARIIGPEAMHLGRNRRCGRTNLLGQIKRLARINRRGKNPRLVRNQRRGPISRCAGICLATKPTAQLMIGASAPSELAEAADGAGAGGATAAKTMRMAAAPTPLQVPM
jgi:hypothetical protein